MERLRFSLFPIIDFTVVFFCLNYLYFYLFNYNYTFHLTTQISKLITQDMDCEGSSSSSSSSLAKDFMLKQIQAQILEDTKNLSALLDQFIKTVV